LTPEKFDAAVIVKIVQRVTPGKTPTSEAEFNALSTERKNELYQTFDADPTDYLKVPFGRCVILPRSDCLANGDLRWTF
jgi:hypothetical protein